MIRTIFAFAALLALAFPAYAGTKTDPHCAGYGEGFVYSPSTGFCVKVSGELRADYSSASSSKALGTGAGSSVQGTLDVRKDTELGPFRAVIQPRAGRY